MIGLAVVGVLVAGGMFGFLQESFVEWVTSPIRFVFSRVVEGVLLIVSFPIILALEGVNSVIAAVFSRPFEVPIEPEATVTPTPTPGPSQDFGFGGGGAGDVRAPDFLIFILQFVRYGLVIATIVVVSIFLYVIASKIAKKLKKDDDDADRESILGRDEFRVRYRGPVLRFHVERPRPVQGRGAQGLPIAGRTSGSRGGSPAVLPDAHDGGAERSAPARPLYAPMSFGET